MKTFYIRILATGLPDHHAKVQASTLDRAAQQSILDWRAGPGAGAKPRKIMLILGKDKEAWVSPLSPKRKRKNKPELKETPVLQKPKGKRGRQKGAKRCGKCGKFHLPTTECA